MCFGYFMYFRFYLFMDNVELCVHYELVCSRQKMEKIVIPVCPLSFGLFPPSHGANVGLILGGKRDGPLDRLPRELGGD